MILETDIWAEVRCPVGREHGAPGRLLMRLHIASAVDRPQDRIEIACEDCKYRLRKIGYPVRRVLHRYTLAGVFLCSEVQDRS